MTPGLHDHPRGIEILLKKAQADSDFRKRFLVNPVSAAGSIELDLSDAERSVLSHTPRSTLETMIENTSIPERFVPIFRRASVATSLVALTACSVIMPLAAVASAGMEESPYDYAEPAYVAEEQMTVIQEGLAWYHSDHGTYPTTDEWAEQDNPLDGYIERIMIFDPWHNRFHYEGIVVDSVVVGYRLESLGENPDSPDDNIPCPIDPELHSFPAQTNTESATDTGAEQ